MRRFNTKARQDLCAHPCSSVPVRAHSARSATGPEVNALEGIEEGALVRKRGE